MPDNLLTPEIETNTPAPKPDARSDARPDGLPEKFWDAGRQEIRISALVASYLALEKKLSTMIAAPQSEEDRRRLQKMLGMPDSADQYEINVPNDLFDIDPDLNARLHAKGFSAEQVQEVYTLAAEKMVPLILEMASEFQADREIERLVREFGGVEKWKEISRQLLSYGRKSFPPQVLEGMACSYEGVMALYKMMQGDEPGLKLKDKGGQETGEDDLVAMMKNPRYWRDKDPAYIAKVTAGFEKIYNRK